MALINRTHTDEYICFWLVFMKLVALFMSNKATSLFIVLRKLGSFLRLPYLCLPFLLPYLSPFIHPFFSPSILSTIEYQQFRSITHTKSNLFFWIKQKELILPNHVQFHETKDSHKINAHCCSSQVMCRTEQGKAEGSGEALISGVFLERKGEVMLALY